MIIEEIELINWGRHKRFQKTLNASVAGLLGKNGSGKSTILAAIKYAFTGVLEQNAETYVRNYGLPNGAKNGSVRIKFIKDGKRGEIFRQVGSSPKRSLSWDGGPVITAAKQVETLLSEIFSASKDAIGNVVFVAQGDLDKMLFGSPSDRADLFMKMMLLDYLPKRSELVKKKIDELSAGITDYSQMRDMVTNDLKNSKQELALQEAVLKSLTDPTPTLDHLRKLEVTAAQLSSQKIVCNNLITTIAEKDGQVRSQFSLLNTALKESGFKEVTDDITLAAEMLEVRESYSKIVRKKLELVQGRQFKKELSDVTQRCFDKKKEVEKTKADLDALLESTPEFVKHANVSDLMLRQDVLRNRQATEASIQEKRARNLVLIQEIEQLRKTDRPDLSMCDNLENQKTQIYQQISDKEKLVKLYTALMADHDCGTKCPLCSSDLSTLKVSKDELHTETMALADLRTQHHKLTGQLETLRASAYNYDRNWDSLAVQVEILEKEMTKCVTLLATIPEVSETMEELRDLINRANVYKLEVSKLNGLHTSASESFESLMTERTKMMSEERSHYVKDYENMMAVFYKDPVEVYEEKEADMRMKDMHLSTMERTHANLVTILQQHKTDFITQDAALKQLEAQFNTLFSACPVKLNHLDEVRSKIEELTAKQVEYHTHGGLLDALKLGHSRLEKQLDDIEIKMAQDQKRRTLIENLRMLRETLNKNGLPMTVMNHQFKLLAELVQDHLANLGANFSVFPDPDKPISFCFVRTDEEEEYVMPQEKLSGGQKVRLTVAMLLAIQQLIIPEVGFLVLDEPSVHLDDEGVDSLRELFQTIGTKMSSTGSQVIVCDHDQRLKTSFSALMEITS